ncbi:MAG: hypothetical protein HXY22_08610 [Alphaproteobacteria bacterium]|nr:hypothetical protein [Alphaproteobacteria bacterium]
MGLGIYAGTLALMTLAALWRPGAGFAALLVMFGLEQWGASQVLAIAERPLLTNVAVAGIVMLAATLQLFRAPLRLALTQPIPMLAAALYTYAVISLAWSPGAEFGWAEATTKAPYLFIVCLIVPMLVRRYEEAATGFGIVALVGSVLLLPMALVVPWDERTIRSAVMPGMETGSPLSLAQFAGYAMVSAILLAPRGWIPWLVSLGIAALCVVIAVKTSSRGQLVAMMIASAAFYPIARGYTGSWRLMLSIGIAGIVAIAGFSLFGDALVEGTYGFRWNINNMTRDAEGRFALVAELLSIWISDPFAILFGLGFSAAISPEVLNGFYAHNIGAEVLCELGLVGFSIFALLLWRCLRLCYQALMTVKPQPGYGVRNRVIALLVALFLLELILAFKQGTLYRNFYLFLFPVMLETLLICEARAVRQMRPKRPVPATRPQPAPVIPFSRRYKLWWAS